MSHPPGFSYTATFLCPFKQLFFCCAVNRRKAYKIGPETACDSLLQDTSSQQIEFTPPLSLVEVYIGPVGELRLYIE